MTHPEHTPTTMTDPNAALLAGEVFGALALHFADVDLERNEHGDYTGRTIIRRPSGLWAVRIEPVEEPEP